MGIARYITQSLLVLSHAGVSLQCCSPILHYRTFIEVVGPADLLYCRLVCRATCLLCVLLFHKCRSAKPGILPVVVSCLQRYQGGQISLLHGYRIFKLMLPTFLHGFQGVQICCLHGYQDVQIRWL